MMGNSNSGRPAKPASLHVLHGDPSHLGAKELERRQNVQYPPMEDFTPPSYFNDFEKKCWVELAELYKNTNVISRLDSWSLMLLVESYAEWREHKEWLDLYGYTMIEVNPMTGAEKIKAHPKVAMKYASHQRVVSLLLQFGWTPASRTKTQQLSMLEKDPIKPGFGARPAV